MSEAVDFFGDGYAFRYFDSGTLLDLMGGGGEWEPDRVVGHLRVLLAVRTYPERRLRLYCERVAV